MGAIGKMQEELQVYKPLTKEEAQRFHQWMVEHSVVRQILAESEARIKILSAR